MESNDVVFSKLDETNRIIKNEAGIIYTLDSRQLLTKMSFFEIPKKSADMGHEFCSLTKTKHMSKPLNFGP